MSLVELQYGIEKPHNIGAQLQKCQPYSLLIYIYFYCQSSENPGEATAPLLPYLVEHVLRLPKGFKPPPHIIKALWLVFAMATISNGTLDSLEERVYLEKAIDRFIVMLQPDPSVYYTHNPALLLWAFTSLRIPDYVKLHVLSQWLLIEDSFPTELTTEPTLPQLLLNVLVHNKDSTIVENCVKALRMYVENEGSIEIADLVWSMLPDVLSKALIDECCLESNVCYLLDFATSALPSELDQTGCVKTAVLLSALYSNNDSDYDCRYEYACLKLCLYLLGLANNQNDNRVLLTYVNREGFLPRVLLATNSRDDKVACASLQLLSYIVHYFNKNNYQPKTLLQIESNFIINSLRKDCNNERGASLLQLVYMVLNSGVNSPLSLAHEPGPCEPQQWSALRALMLRVQLMLCSRESKTQTSAGWKTLSTIFKHAIVTKNDTKLVAILTSQPWTHVLIQFQLTQNTTIEFLTFVQNWLTLLKITLKKSQDEKKIHPNRQSLVIKTLLMIKKNTVDEDDLKEINNKVLVVVKDILEESKVRIRKN
ncbi:uncharacterized protein LOC114240900 [Bombyx mandarina]|uniref:Uncharacterized protein LOC114240900 n=1 Tax=Bombyx mandarina TaxID=7092 RepID=A0A6J2JDJ2_BOMMA|nr:uncharacterized protein LOC114240900 [Bombyx mandarina]